MHRTRSNKAAIPNPALQPFGVLVGEWSTVGTHPAIPGTTLHGRTSFEWLEGGAFLLMRSEMDEPRIPTGIAVIGSDDTAGEFHMLYFDERGVSRKCQVEMKDDVWTWWRSAPGMSQRYTGTITNGGNTIIGKGEICTDGSTWERDLDLTYTRND